MSLQQVTDGDQVLTLLPEPPAPIDNVAQRKARHDLMVALHNYYSVFYLGRAEFAEDVDQLPDALRKRATHWMYEAEYAAFLRPSRVDVSGHVITGE